MRYLIRSASLTNYVTLARSVGLDPYRMLASVRLDRSCLLDPDTRIPADAVGRLLESSARVSGCEDFGLRMAETRHLSNLGPLGLVVKESPTLRDMLDTLVRYMRLHNESLFLRVEEHGRTVVIVQDLGATVANPVRQAIELAIGVTFRILQTFLGPDWRPLRVCFVHGPPADLRTHRRVFTGTPVDFRAELNGIVCRASDLARPIPRADPVLARYARQYIDSLAAGSGTTFRDQVRQLVHTLLPSGQCAVERIAQHLGIDRRTVHRRLAREGTTFSALVDGVRDDLARRHVAEGDRALSDIAELLGFSALSAFSRWFRQRHGCSVTAWRQQAGAVPAAPLPPGSVRP